MCCSNVEIRNNLNYDFIERQITWKLKICKVHYYSLLSICDSAFENYKENLIPEKSETNPLIKINQLLNVFTMKETQENIQGALLHALSEDGTL